MKSMTPIKTLREVGGETPRTLEQAEFANAAYGRIETEPAPPDRATGLPMPAHDAVFSNAGGYGSLISPGGPRDTTEFPEHIAAVSGTRSTVDPNARDFGHELTPNEPDGWEDRGSGIANITGRGRG
jgi:hypothetical protein